MPSLNEEKSIAKTIDSIPLEKLKNTGYDVEILVVDGGSTDRTVEAARTKGARIIVCEPGYGRQLRTGFCEASGDIIITADSDFSYPLEDALSLVTIMEKENLDFITTNRFAAMEKGAMHLVNRFGNIVLTFINNLIFSLNLKDSQSGMWVIRKNAIPRLMLASNGMTLSQEIKIEAFTKLKALEVDSRYRRRVGKVKLKRLKDGWEVLFHIFKKKWG